jgi:hypothetical protein
VKWHSENVLAKFGEYRIDQAWQLDLGDWVADGTEYSRFAVNENMGILFAIVCHLLPRQCVASIG